LTTLEVLTAWASSDSLKVPFTTRFLSMNSAWQRVSGGFPARLAAMLAVLLTGHGIVCLADGPAPKANDAPPAQGKPITSVVFILDCSGSMSVTPGRRATRMEMARDHFQSTLKNDLVNGECRVGLILFGHRVGWERDGQLTRFNRAMIPAAVDRRALHPASDVEMVVPIQALNDQTRQQLEAPPLQASPWGQTPLYASIKLGLEQLALDKQYRDQPRKVIVITDGENDPGRLDGNQPDVTANDLIRMLKDPLHQAIQLDLVAVDFKPGPQLVRLTQMTGGEIHQVPRAVSPGSD
jgi:Mg-chelatase subunit ChlD